MLIQMKEFLIKFLKRRSRIIHSLMFLFLLLMTNIGVVQALDYGGIGGRPATSDPDVQNSQSWFIYNLPAKTQKQDILIVVNSTDEEQEVMVYPADSTPSSDGAFALKQKTEAMTDIGNWIKLYPSEAVFADDAVWKSLYPEASDSKSIIDRCSIIQLSAGDLAKSLEVVASLKGKKLSAVETAYLTALVPWCQGVSEYTFKLAPNTQTELPFVISIPETADVGEHTGGIMVQKVEAQQVQGTGIALTTRVGIRVYETVPGEQISKITLGNFNYTYDVVKKSYSFSVAVKNEGNVGKDVLITLHIINKLTGQEIILDQGKKSTFERPLQVMRNDQLVSNFEWQAPALGYYQVQADISYDDNGQAMTLNTSDLIIIVVPWLYVGAILVLIALVVVIIIYRKSRYRRKVKKHQWKQYRVKRDVSLMQLARVSGVNWKTLAKINKIKKPYFVEAGRTVKLPAVAVKPKTRRPATGVKKTKRP